MQQSKIISFDGLGTHWECELLDENCSESRAAVVECILVEYLNEFVKKYSRFDSDSLVGRLNKESQIANPPEEMLKMFKFARDIFQVTGGVFDISVGGILNSIGYGVPSDHAIVTENFWDLITFTNEFITIPKGVAIDFGGFGKGWLIDAFVEILRKNGFRQFIVNGGGDLYVQSNTGIDIALEHPFDSTKFISRTRIKNGALAVSSVIKRSWLKNGIKHHHIINPSTGRSSNSEIICSFVKADSALMADTMATVLIIRPDLNQGLSEQFNLQTILLSKDQFKI